MIVYGRGCAGCQTIASTVQPLRRAPVPDGVAHGREITHRLYGCMCADCRRWEAREAMEKGGRHGRGQVQLL